MGEITYNTEVYNILQTLSYKCTQNIISSDIVWIQLEPDQDTVEFIESLLYIYHKWYGIYSGLQSSIRTVFSLYLHHTDVLATLDCGKMFILSSTQIDKLLKSSYNDNITKSTTWGDLLDIGTGDGKNLQRWKKLFNTISCTEVNKKMIKKLQIFKDTNIYETDNLKIITDKFDIITLCNVIDRCNKPQTLLNDITNYLKNKDSRIIITAPLPLRQSVETINGWKEPDESLQLSDNYFNRDWEYLLCELITMLQTKFPYKVCCVSRVPYISQGDFVNPYYTQDAAVLVLAPLYFGTEG